MVSFTGITEERALQIDNSSIISSNLITDNLTLENRNGNLVNAGYVRGGAGRQQTYIPGIYYGPGGGRTATLQTFDLVTFSPFFIHGTQPVSFQKIGFEITVASGNQYDTKPFIPLEQQGCPCYLGMYSDNGFGKPYQRLLGGGHRDYVLDPVSYPNAQPGYGAYLAMGSIAGAFQLPSLLYYPELYMGKTFNPGLYWLAFLCAEAADTYGAPPAPTIRTITNNIGFNAGSSTLSGATAASPMIGWTMPCNITADNDRQMPDLFSGNGRTASPPAIVLQAA